MIVNAICHTCAHQHKIDFDPAMGPGAAFSDWLTKHPGHEIDFVYPRRSHRDKQVAHPWMSYIHNADVKTAYAASTAPTITLASLAASSTLVAGRESSAIDNGASNKYLDYYVAGHFRTGAANLQAGTIRIGAVGAIDDTPTWPSVFDGTDSTEDVSVQGIYDQIVRVIASIATDTTQRTWPFGPTAIASLFGGVVPDQFVLFVSHNAHTSTNVWSATEADHLVKLTGVYATVT